jgi:predicted transcriptional regulator
MAKRISVATGEKIKRLSDGGLGQKYIAKTLGISQSTVSKYIRDRGAVKTKKAPEESTGPYKSYGQRKAEEFIAAGGAKVDVDPAWYFDRKK